MNQLKKGSQNFNNNILDENLFKTKFKNEKMINTELLNNISNTLINLNKIKEDLNTAYMKYNKKYVNNYITSKRIIKSQKSKQFRKSKQDSIKQENDEQLNNKVQSKNNETPNKINYDISLFLEKLRKFNKSRSLEIINQQNKKVLNESQSKNDPKNHVLKKISLESEFEVSYLDDNNNSALKSQSKEIDIQSNVKTKENESRTNLKNELKQSSNWSSKFRNKKEISSITPNSINSKNFFDSKDVYSINSAKISIEIMDVKEINDIEVDQENLENQINSKSEYENSNLNNHNLAILENDNKKMFKSNSERSISLKTNIKNNISKTIKNKTLNTKEKLNLEMEVDELRNFNELESNLDYDDRMVLVLSYNLELLFYNRNTCIDLLIDKNEFIHKPAASLITPQSYKNLSFVLKEVIKSFFNDPDSKIMMNLTNQVDFQDKSLREIKYHVNLETMAQKTKNGTNSCMIILYCTNVNDKNLIYVIDSSNIFQVCYSLILLLIIVFLLTQTPQDISFGDDSFDSFNLLTDRIITVIFSTDIIINFFVSYKDNDGNEVYDLKTIAQNYLTTSLQFDILASFPFQELIEFNTAIIKSFKITKILKILKILKISKIVNLKNSNVKAQLDEELIIQFKRSLGFFNLVGQNLKILICSHFYTSFFQQVKCNLIEKDKDDQGWLYEYQGLQNATKFETYCFLLQENLKIALGLGAIGLSNPIEVLIQMSWIFLGMSMFGQAIGNISSYLNFMNHNEIEKYDNINQFNDLCEMHNVDHRIQQMIKLEIENHQKNFNETNLYEKCKILSLPLIKNLENFVYKEFLSSFKLLNRLSMQTIRLMKNNLKLHRGKFKLVKGSDISEVFFITKGFLKLQDENMNLKNFQYSHEFYGFQEWIEQANNRFGFDLLEIIKIEDEQQDQEGKFFTSKENLDIINDCRNIVEQCTTIKNNFDHFNSQIEFNENIQENEDIKTFSYLPVSSDDLEWFSLPYSAIDSILINDFTSFISIWGYWRSQNLLISPKEINEINSTLKYFENNELPGLMLNDKGCVIKQNKSMLDQQSLQSEQIIKNRFIDLIQYEISNESKVNDIQLLTNTDYKVLINEKYQIMSIINSQRKLLKLKNIGKRRVDLENKFEQDNLKKSLIDVKVIQFEIEDL